MRRPEFRLQTEFAGEGKGRVVRKLAEGAESSPFLETILVREELAEQFYGASSRVMRGRVVGEAIEYPFVSFPSLADQIGAAARSNDPACALELIERYVSFLEDLPCADLVPHVFLDCVGAPEGVYRCFELGPADCIPQNIMIDGDDWLLIDHEWMMGFPVPVDWVIYRGISSLFYSFQDLIRSQAGPERPVAIFAGRREHCYAPLDWLAVLDRRKLPLDQLEDWYFGWQQQILISPSRRCLRPGRRSLTRIPGRLHPRAVVSDLVSIARSVLMMRGASIASGLPPNAVLLAEERV